LTTINESFAPVPILKARLRDQELVGAELLESMGAEVYSDADPAAVLFSDDPMAITKRGSDYVLTLRLPFAKKDSLELSAKGDEMFVKVGPYRRTIMLPKVLASRRITSAQLLEDRLEVVFERRPSDG
jgi:arsenite/tail-anchored protein-transporting ATPase